MSVWTAAPRGWASWDYYVQDDSDRPIGRAGRAFWRERGQIECADGLFEVGREPGWGAFVLSRDGAVVARARKQGVFGRTFEIELGTAPYVLRPSGFWARNMVLLRGDREVGRIEVSFWTRRMRVLLPDDLPIPMGLFVLWLTVLLHRRAAAAAS